MPAGTELFGISASISVDTSQFDREIEKASDAVDEFASGMKSIDTGSFTARLSGAIGSLQDIEDAIDDYMRSSEESKKSTEGLGETVGQELPEQVEKGEKSIISFSDILKGTLIHDAINGAIDAIKRLGNSIVGIAEGAVASYGSYEQLADGVRTIFKGAADGVLADAEEAWQKAGMSSTTYLQTIISISNSVMSGLKRQYAQLSEEEIEERTEALDKQLEAETKAINEEYSLKKKAYDKEYKLFKSTLDKEYQARKEQLEDVYDALSDSLDREIDAYQKSSEKRLDEAQRAYDKDVDAYEKATKARIKLIDKEYLESIKLIDEEKYNRLKAIDDQIEALENLTEQERRQREKREQAEKKSSLEQAIDDAATFEEREKAYEALVKFNLDTAQKDRENQRKEQIAALKEQKEVINDEADAKKEAAKEKRDAAKEAVEEEKDVTLAAMKERFEAEKEAMKEAQDAELDSMRKSKEAQLKELKRSQSEELSSIKEAQADQLSSMKEAHTDELAELKTANSERLKELKRHIKEEKVLLATGVDVSTLTEDELEEIYELTGKLSGQALRDVSDIANKMGVDVGTAIRSLINMTRGQFQMLDSLNIGYSGTKTEAQRMLDDAEKIQASQGKIVDYSIDNAADILEALHVVLKDLDIVGTTEKEAAGTLEGSMNAVKNSWANLVTELGKDGADIDGKTKALTDNLEIYWNNLEPVLTRIADNFGKFLDDFLPKVKTWADEHLPQFVAVIKEFIGNIWDAVSPELGPIAKEVVGDIHEALKEEFPVVGPLLEVAFGGWLIGSLVKSTVNIGGALLPAAKNIFTGLGEALTSHGAAGGTLALGKVFSGIIAGAIGLPLMARNVSKLSEASDAYSEAKNTYEAEMDRVLSTYEEKFKNEGKQAASEWAKAMYDVDIWTGFDLETGKQILAGKINELWADVPKNMLDAFNQGVEHYWDAGAGSLLADAFGSIVSDVKSFLGIGGDDSSSEKFEKIGENTAKGFEEGWKEKEGDATKAVEETAGDVIEGFTSKMEIESPSKVFKKIAKNVLAGFSEGWDEYKKPVIQEAGETAKNITDAFKFMFQDVPPSRVFEGLAGDVLAGFEKGWREREPVVLDMVKNTATNIVNVFKSMLGIASPSKVFEDLAEEIPAGAAKGILAGTPVMVDAVEDMSDLATSSFDYSTREYRGGTIDPWDLDPRTSTDSVPRDITTVLRLNEYEFGRVVYRLYNEEAQRHGIDLVMAR